MNVFRNYYPTALLHTLKDFFRNCNGIGSLAFGNGKGYGRVNGIADLFSGFLFFL